MACSKSFLLICYLRPKTCLQKRKQARRFMPPGLRFCPGAPGPIRTADTRFRRAVLYPLSYEGKSVRIV